MRVEIITLFPEFFEVCGIGLLGKAIAQGRAEVVTRSPREFATDKHNSVDDAPYGGGAGMVLMPGPYVETIESLDQQRSGKRARKILLSPQGKRFTQSDAARLSQEECLTLVCGRYEGFDERIRSFVDEEISLGDFVMLGGETAALAIMEAVLRLRPGVVGNDLSTGEESHAQGLLEYPQYTRPEEFRGMKVPSVLLSGNHAAIAAWRSEQALQRTRERRPDMLDNREASADERKK